MHQAPRVPPAGTMVQEPDFRAALDDRPVAPPRRGGGMWLLVLLVIAGLGFAWYWQSRRTLPQEAPVTAPAAAAPAAPAAPAPVVTYPQPDPGEQALRSEQVLAALDRLLGARAVASFVQTDGFVRRLAATVDSLGRAHSPTAAWPVFPTGGRFTVEERPDGVFIASENASRYTAFVQLVESVDARSAVDLYRRMYPLLQRAYRELGFGDRSLNDRVIAVVELLLATPQPQASPRLELTEVKGPVPSTRPWLRYQFADPELEDLSAGQKILLRTGPANERRLKAKLAQLHAQLVSGGASAAPVRPAASR